MNDSQRTRWAALWVSLVFAYNAAVTASQAPHPDVIPIIWSGLSGFAGSYAPVEGQPDQPTAAMAAGLSAALVTTFGTAILLAIRLSQRGWRRLQAASTTNALVVIGSSPEADQIARSVAPDRLIRVHEAPAARNGHLTLGEAEDLTQDKALRKVLGTAEAVMVAASTDRESVRIARAVKDHTHAPGYHLIRSSALAQAMRPRVLRSLPPSETFHPHDRVGQIVTEIAVRTCTGTPTQIHVLRCGSGTEPDSVAAWLARAKEADRFLSRELTKVVVSIGDAAALQEPLASASLVILAGEPEQVAAQASTWAGITPLIAVVDRGLINLLPLPPDIHVVSHRESPQSLPSRDTVLVVDPSDALRHENIQQGIAAQWGRAFNDAYNQLYATKNPSATPLTWNTHKLGKAEQSSIAAARFMLDNLQRHGYQLELGPAGWPTGWPPEDIVEKLARSEHTDWMTNRYFTDTDGARHPVSHRLIDGEWRPSNTCREFDLLDNPTQEYNRALIRQVYPALAAMFGYGIRPA